MGTGAIPRGPAAVVVALVVGAFWAAPAVADNMGPPPTSPSPPPTAHYSPPATTHYSPSPTPPPVIRTPSAPGTVVVPGPRTQTRTPAGGGSGSVRPQAPAESWIDPSLADAPPAVDDQSPSPQIGLSGQPVPPGPTATAPAVSSTSASSPLAPIGAALALAAGLGLLAAGLKPRAVPCEQAMNEVSLRCQALLAAGEEVRVAQGRYESADFQLRTALSVADPSVGAYRRERHHARDGLVHARSRATEAQAVYEAAIAAVPATCGACPPCVTSGMVQAAPVVTPV